MVDEILCGHTVLPMTIKYVAQLQLFKVSRKLFCRSSICTIKDSFLEFLIYQKLECAILVFVFKVLFKGFRRAKFSVIQ